MSLSLVRELLQPLIPPGIIIEVSSGEATIDLLPEEAAATQEWAAHRRAQFALGRSCARHALGRLHASPVPILFDEEGVPTWPFGFVGSISHKRQNCVVAVGRSSHFEGIGVDLERDARAQEEEEIVRRVCATVQERSQARALQEAGRSSGSLFLSAKEAFFKLHFPITRVRLDWEDVEVTFGPTTFTAREVKIDALKGEGFFVTSHGWIITVVRRQKPPVIHARRG